MVFFSIFPGIAIIGIPDNFISRILGNLFRKIEITEMNNFVYFWK